MASTPPDSIEDLRRFLEDERGATGRSRMGKRALAVLSDMLDRPGSAAVQSISELAARNGVEPSTLTRLGKRMGFSGFAPLQDVFRKHVSATQPFYSHRVDGILSAPGGRAPAHFTHQLAQSECQKVMAVATNLDQKSLEDAVVRLVKAKRVYVLAARGAYGIGHFFGTYLSTLMETVTIVSEPDFLLASALSRLQPTDLLVAISFRPYTRSIVKAVEIARAESVPVLAITDSGSLIAPRASGGATVVVDQPYYFDSALAQYFVAEAILVGVARKLGHKGLASIQRREAINRALDNEVD